MVKRVPYEAADGNFDGASGKTSDPTAVPMWRKIRTFELVDGDFDGVTRSHLLNTGLSFIIDDVLATTSAHWKCIDANEGDGVHGGRGDGDGDRACGGRGSGNGDRACGGRGDGERDRVCGGRGDGERDGLDEVKITGEAADVSELGHEEYCDDTHAHGESEDDNESDGNGDAGKSVLRVGMVYPLATASLNAVQDYALVEGKSVKVARRSGMDRQIRFSSPGCSFVVQVYRQRNGKGEYDHWYISSLTKEHMNCVSTPKPTHRQIARLPTFVGAVHASASTPARALTSLVRERDGISLVGHLRSVYRARELVNGVSEVSLRTSYQMISSYLEKFSELNPGSIARVERDNEGRFFRAMVSVKHIADSMADNQRVVGIDCAHSKCPAFNGQQMTLVVRTATVRRSFSRLR
ncbi:hypothetical protein BBJ28_00015842 [Nothophytophthora sp. Chile5]|nr:hypothetical protein BBJ28_00015842 [Nothophytophthora sp. Chile5]